MCGACSARFAEDEMEGSCLRDFQEQFWGRACWQ
jgi:hypothetical protein